MLKPNLRLVIESAIYLTPTALALWRGRRPERLVALIIIGEFVLIGLAQYFQRMEQPRYLNLVVEALTLSGILYVTFTTDRRWLLFASAFQILVALAIITRIIDPTIHAWSYVTIGIVCSYGLVASLAFGTLQVMLNSRKVSHERH